MSLLPYIFDLKPSKSVLSWPSLVSFDDGFFQPQRLSNVWEQITQSHKDITIDKDKFQANIDVQQYKPEEIVVKLTGANMVTIEGKHEETAEHAYASRSFSRSFTLPENCDVQKLQTKLSSEGLLVLSVPTHSEKEILQISDVNSAQSLTSQNNFEKTTRERKRTTKKTVNQSSMSSQQSVFEHNKKMLENPKASVASTTIVQENVQQETQQNGSCPANISRTSRIQSSEKYNQNETHNTNIPHQSVTNTNAEQSTRHQKEQVRTMSNSSVTMESSGTASPIIQFPESPDVFSGRNKFIGETQQSTRHQKRQVRTSSNSSLVIEQVEEAVSNRNDRKVKDIPPLPTGRSKTTTTEEQIIKEKQHVRNAPVESTSITNVNETNYNERRQTHKSERKNSVEFPSAQEYPVSGVTETVIKERHEIMEGPVTVVETTRTQNVQQSTRQQKQQVRTSSNSSVVIEQVEESVSNKNNKTTKDTPNIPTGRSKENNGIEEPTYESAPLNQETPVTAKPDQIYPVEDVPQVREVPVTVVESTKTKNVQQSTRQQKKQVRTSSNSTVVVEQVEETVSNKKSKAPNDSPAIPTGRSTVTTTEEEIIDEEQQVRKIPVDIVESTSLTSVEETNYNETCQIKKPTNKPKENNDVEEPTCESAPLNQETPVTAKPAQIYPVEDVPQVREVPVTVVEPTKTQNVQQSTRQQKQQVRTSSNTSVVIEQVEETVCNKKNKVPKDSPAIPTGRSTVTTTEEEIIDEEQQVRKIPVDIVESTSVTNVEETNYNETCQTKKPTNKPKENNGVEEPTCESAPLNQESPVTAKPDQIYPAEDVPQVREVPVTVVEPTKTQNVQQSTRQQKQQVRTSSNTSVVIEQVEETVCNKKNKVPKDSPAIPTGRSTVTTTEEEIIDEEQQVRKIPIDIVESTSVTSIEETNYNETCQPKKPTNKPKENNDVEEQTCESAPLNQESPATAKPNQIYPVEDVPQVREVPVTVVEPTKTQNVQQSTRQQKKQVRTSSNSTVVVEQVEETVSNKTSKAPKDTPAIPTGRSTVTTTEKEIIDEEQQVRKIPIDIVESTSVTSIEETNYNETCQPKKPTNKPKENNDVEEQTCESAPLNQESPATAKPNQIYPVEDVPQVREVPVTVVEPTKTQNVQQSTRQQKKQVRTSSNSTVVVEQVEETVSNKTSKAPKDTPAIPTGRSTVTTTEKEIIDEEQQVRKIPIDIVESTSVTSIEETNYNETCQTKKPTNKPKENNDVEEPTCESAPLNQETPATAKPDQIYPVEDVPQVREVPVTVVEPTKTQNVQQSTRQQKQQVRTSSNSSVVVEQVEETVSNKTSKAPKDTPAKPTGGSAVPTTEEEIIKEEQVRNIPIKIVQSTSVSSVEETSQNQIRQTTNPINKPKGNNGVEEPTYQSAPLNQESPVAAKPNQIYPVEDVPRVREIPVTVVESTKTQNVQQSTRQQKQQVRTSSNSSVVIEKVEESVSNTNNRTTKDTPTLPTGRKITTTEEQIIKEQQQVRNVPINIVESTTINNVEEINSKKIHQNNNKSQVNNGPQQPIPNNPKSSVNAGVHKTNTIEKTVIEERHQVREVPINVVESIKTQNVQQSSTRQQKQQVRTSSNSSVIIEQVIPSTRSKVTTTEERVVKEQHFTDVPITIVDSSSSVRNTDRVNQNQKQRTKKNVNKSETVNTAETNTYSSVPSSPIYPDVVTGSSSNKVRETVIEERHHQRHYAQDVPVTVIKTENIEQSSHRQQQQVRRNSNSSVSTQNAEQNIYNNRHVKNVPVGLSGVSKVKTTTEYVVRENQHVRDVPVAFTQATSTSNVQETRQNQRQQFMQSNNYRTTEECSKLNQQQSTKRNVQESKHHHQQHIQKGFNNQSTTTRNVEESHHNQKQVHNGTGGATVTRKYKESKYQHQEQVRNVPGVSQNVQQINEHYQTSNTSVRSSQ